MNRIEALKKRKKEMGITFDQLAEKTGLSRRAICGLFSGKTENPRLETVQAIERALGLAPTFTEEERAQGASNAPIALSDRDLNTLGRINRAEEVLGEAYVDAVLDLLDLNVEQKLKESR